MGRKRRININGTRITNLRFADDVIEQFKEMLEELEIQCRKGRAGNEYRKNRNHRETGQQE